MNRVENRNLAPSAAGVADCHLVALAVRFPRRPPLLLRPPASGTLWLLTLGLAGVGFIYDFWTLNAIAALAGDYRADRSGRWPTGAGFGRDPGTTRFTGIIR